MEDHRTILDSGASGTFFKYREEVQRGSYGEGSKTLVTMAAGNKPAKFIGSGTVEIGKLKLKAQHLASSNSTLL